MRKGIALIMFFVVGILCCCVSCSNDDTTGKFSDPARAASYYMQLIKDHDYDALVDGIQSCDSAAPDYKQHMKILLKQHIYEQTQLYGKLLHFESVSFETNHEVEAASVYVHLIFEKDSTQTVMIPLVWNGKSWKLR